MLTGDVTVDDGAPDIEKYKSESAPRHGDAIADFYFQGKTSLRVRTIAIPSRSKTSKSQAVERALLRFLQLSISVDVVVRWSRFRKRRTKKTLLRRGDAFCRKFVKRKGVGQNAIPSQNETGNKLF